MSGSMQGAGGVGGLLAVQMGSAWYFPFYDNNGNITAYADETGAIVAEYTYDAFGRTISTTGLLADTFRHRFSTKYYDTETDFYYYSYRFYAPELMRWLNRDPIEEQGGKNVYCFVGNRALVNSDKLGLWWKTQNVTKSYGPVAYSRSEYCCCEGEVKKKGKQKTGIRRCCEWDRGIEVGSIEMEGKLSHCWLEFGDNAFGF